MFGTTGNPTTTMQSKQRRLRVKSCDKAQLYTPDRAPMIANSCTGKNLVATYGFIYHSGDPVAQLYTPNRAPVTANSCPGCDIWFYPSQW